VLRLVFLFSGAASLMYQVVWQRLLTVYYGVGPMATTLIVSVYMLGLGLGALVGGAAAERVKSRVTMYMVVELLLGAFGVASPWLLDLLGRSTAGASYPVAMLWMALFLSAPTILMGTTLPLLTKAVNAVAGEFLKSLSFLYFINTLGAALGALTASYVVISLYGLDTAAYVAAAINLLLAAAVFPLRSLDREAPASGPAGDSSGGTLGRWAYLCVFATGFLAIGYEILWFRFLGVMMKDSPYAFSTILAIYLLGIALGSLLMSRYRQSNLRLQGQSTFFLLQVLIGAYLWITLAGFCYADAHVEWFHKMVAEAFTMQLQPYPLQATWAANWKTAGGYASVLGYPLAFVFVPTLLMGASFPLVTSLALRRADREGKTVGTVYFFNILGNVAGGIVTGFWLLSQFGMERTAMGFSIAGLAALLLVERFAGLTLRPAVRVVAFAVLAVAAVLTFPGRGEFYSLVHGAPWGDGARYIAEGIDAVVVTDDGPAGTANSINGLSHGSRPAAWYTREVFEAFSYAPKCRDVLVIGFGAGTFVENALMVDEVQHVTLVEISDSVIENFRKIPAYEKLLPRPSDNPPDTPQRISVIADDGRRFLLRTDHKYDMILIDPLRTTTSYSNNLYSREFFELVRQHLKPEGLFLAWMDDYWVFPKTLSSVFPKVREYSFGDYMGFCMASSVPLFENEARAHALFAKYPPWMQRDVQAVADYMGDESYIRQVHANSPLAHDWKPVMEYYFWREFQHARWETPGEP
jgi:spermidine synthase